jgi:hypothetical protein
MWKTVRQFFKWTANSHGFTLIEAITLVGVLSVLGVVLWSGAALAMRASTDMNSTLDDSSTLLKVECLLREKCANVRYPFWLNGCVYEQEENTLTVFYYHGAEHNTLRLTFEGEQLWITENISTAAKDPGQEGAQQQKQNFGPFQKAEFSLARNQNRGVYGITVKILPKREPDEQTAEDETFTVTTEFGSLPLGSTESNE